MIKIVISLLFFLAAVLLSPERITAQSQEQQIPWSYSLSASGNIVAQGADYLQPTLTADRETLHLEARYNNEGLNTASLWSGYNFSLGETVNLKGTPMIGVVFGDVQGIAPGYETTITLSEWQLVSQGSYIFSTNHTSDSDFNTWTTLMVSPVDWFQIGGAAQRTKANDSNVSIDRGPIIGFIYKQYNPTFYILNIDRADSTYVFSLAVTF